MRVAICGPNLNDQSKGQFHVHKEGCRDLRRYGPESMDRYLARFNIGGEGPWVVEVATVRDVVFAVMGDILSDYNLEPGTDEANDKLDEWRCDFHFAPCVRTLKGLRSSDG